MILKLANSLLTKIRDKSAVVAVVGLGYVGLPLALEKAKAGFKVIGMEQNPSRVKMINAGKNYILDVNDQELETMVRQGRLSAVNDFCRVPEADIIAICVPTPLTKNLTPDLHYIETTTRKISELLRPGQLITLESTTYPGTTEEIMLPILNQSGLHVEEEFFLAHSPERVDPGNPCYATKNTTKILGAVGPESMEVALAFYSESIDKMIPLSCTQAAELAKVFENTFRAVNIALVNEIALLCDRMGLNVWEVLEAAFTKPFGIMPFYPGPGVGGHCIPIDPHYLEWKAKEMSFNTHFIALAGEINRSMPGFVREKALRILGRNGIASSRARILILGVTYKKDIADKRESPALEIIRLLTLEGSQVDFHDPFINQVKLDNIELDSVSLDTRNIASYDLIIIVTDHSSIDYPWLVQHGRRIFDTRNATRDVIPGREKITLL